MVSKEEFVESWLKSKSEIRKVHFSHGFILANAFMFDVTKGEGKYIMRLQVNTRKCVTNTGYISLDDITEIE